METEMRRILDELRTIKIEIEFIKENMVEKDAVLTEREEEDFESSLGELKRGESFSLKDLENARG